MKSLLFLILILLKGTYLHGIGDPVAKISEQFEFDGLIKDGEWDLIPEIQLTVMSPTYKAEPTQKTIMKMAYDENYLYLMGELYEEDPTKIQGNSKLRDGGDPSTDFFGLVIDSYNDKQNALSFFTTPTGSRFDAAILNDARSQNSMNTSWNNFWDVKTQTTDEGWFVEMRIPFSSLQYQVVDNKVTMGITAWRYIAHNNEVQISPDISPDMGDMGMFRPSQSKEYIFEGIRQKKPFYITPYVLAGVSRENELNETNQTYDSDDQLARDVGLDVKLGITNNFTLDLTLNTDFAQVEVDDQQINLTRFSLFFPEKRLFFQERSGIFSFALGRQNNLFYSRRIGIDGDGNAIPIIGGARLTGRTGNLDLGLISMQTQAAGDFATTNYSVFRTKRRILNEYSDVGFLLTNTIDGDGHYNTVYGFDSNIKVGKDDFLQMKFAQSFTDGLNNNALSVDPSAFWISLSRRSTGGFTYGTSISRLGEDFDSNLGFLDRTNYTRIGTRLQYNWFPGEDSRLFQHGPSIRGVSFWDNTTNSYNNASYGAGYTWAWKNGSSLFVGARFQFDDITEEFDLANVAIVPVGKYFYPALSVEFGTTNSVPYFVMGNISSGRFFDGYRNGIALAPTYNINSTFSLSGTYEFNHVDFDSRDQSFIAHIGRVKALLMFSTKFSISSFIQYNSLDRQYFGNIRLRYNPREGVDLFIVYNTDMNTNRALESPMLPLTNQSSILLKYSYTFVL